MLTAAQQTPAKLTLACCTSEGVRPVNEDRVHMDPRRGLLLVADGCGGEGKGDLAASMVLESLEAPGQTPLAALEAANARIHRAIQADQALKGMGATVALAALEGDRADLYYVGEVRAYLVRGGSLLQLTEDHTLATQLVKLKQITPEQAATHPARKSIMRYLGKEEASRLEHLEVRLQPGDLLLLCTDGFYAALPPAVLVGLADPAFDLAERLEEALRLALANGSQDNLSAAAVRMAAGPAPAELGPAEVSGLLRGLVEQFLATSTPVEDHRALCADLLSLAIQAVQASGGLLVKAGASGPEVLAAQGASELAPYGDLEAALGGERPLARDGRHALPVSSGVALCVELAPGRVLAEEAIAPYLELARWLDPLLRMARG